ncbi:GreA/GreB family elongation factor [Asticcacaulis sp. 201]|uniref:GreA/GreB family elongation factor n=1 Tax=Asticcacaulis sp. 201 TaxID=3028787 RepID=UPI002916FDCF|nr:GreA/GreB family elongation factor [Asticcacaulis sp. 201]MDV6329921.1 GreA/GreB family elongation factor [Asticcacaulis sp. 201]
MFPIQTQKTKTTQSKPTRPPDIVIGDSDFATLTALAESAGGPLADAADQLLTELDRALRVPDHALPEDRVRLYDWIAFQTGDGAARRVQLVRPEDADIAEGRVSVLTPVGAALIGLAPGKPIAFATPGGGLQTLTVLTTARGE